MISIIISTVNESLRRAIEKNIEATVGIQHEIVFIDNSDGSRGLCEVYNIGAKQASFNVLCFMHEDVQIKTDDWGKIVLKHFATDDSLGLLGVVGSTYKSSVFSGWGPYGSPTRIDYANIIQGYRFKDSPDSHYYHNPDNSSLKEVAALDGVWLCSKREIILKHPFDQDTFKRFHCYDLDISLSIGKHYKVAVTFDILMKHFSEGRFEEEWAEATMLLHKKWKDQLPVNKAGFNSKGVIFCEKRTFRKILPFLFECGYSLKQVLEVLNYSKVWSLSPVLYIKLYLSALRVGILSK